MRRIDELLTNYSNDHQNPANQRMHLVCVPLIMWTVTAMLWCIPVPDGSGGEALNTTTSTALDVWGW